MTFLLKTTIFCLLSSLSLNQASAQKNSNNGEQIKADVFNSSTLSVGSIQQSLLPVSQFQSLNGDCWVPMLGQSVSGSDLAGLGISTLPDASGRFLRNAGGNAAPVAQTQEDELKSHTHIQNSHNHAQNSHGHDLLGAGGGVESLTSSATRGVMGANSGGTYDLTSGAGSRYVELTTATNIAATATNQNTGGIETRPQNLTVNMFIKINKQCNFN